MRIATPKPTLDTLPPADVRYSVPRPVFPQSHSPRDCDATTEDQEEVKIWQWWDKHITASLRLPEGYRQVHVLMIKWMDEIDTSETRDEVNRLAGIFEIKFNFHVTEAELGSRNTQFQLEGRISQWLAENNCKDNLLIVYYAGHGTYMNEKKELKISPTRDMDDAAASWTDAEQIFFKEDVEADIFLIMDCSYASDMMRSTEDNGRAFLLLAACNIGKTTPSPGPHSFTSSLITVLTELADEYRERESTTWDLIERLKKARIEYKNSTPEVYRKLAGNRHIGLR